MTGGWGGDYSDCTLVALPSNEVQVLISCLRALKTWVDPEPPVTQPSQEDLPEAAYMHGRLRSAAKSPTQTQYQGGAHHYLWGRRHRWGAQTEVNLPHRP